LLKLARVDQQLEGMIDLFLVGTEVVHY